MVHKNKINHRSQNTEDSTGFFFLNVPSAFLSCWILNYNIKQDLFLPTRTPFQKAQNMLCTTSESRKVADNELELTLFVNLKKTCQLILGFCSLFSACAAGYGDAGSPGAGCVQCPPGEFKAFAGDAACIPCPANSHSQAFGATSCGKLPIFAVTLV